MKKKVLVVDDDVELCHGISDFLRLEGYVVKSASDPFTAIDLINKHDFDVALLDYKMSAMSGLDVLRIVKNKNPQTRVFLVTGRPFIEKILDEENLASLVSGVIQKPFDANIFLETIKAA